MDDDDDEEAKKEQHELESVVEAVGSPPHQARMSDGNMTMASSKNNTVVDVERRSSAK